MNLEHPHPYDNDSLEQIRETRDFAIDALKKIDSDNSESIVWALIGLLDLGLWIAEQLKPRNDLPTSS